MTLDDDQKQSLSMAIGVLAARVDTDFHPDDREGNELILLDHYVSTIYDADAKVSAGLAALANVLIVRLANATGHSPHELLQQVKTEFGLDESV